MGALHPAVSLAMAGLLLIGSQILTGGALALGCLVALGAALAAARRRLPRLLRRSRFLLLAIVVMFAWFTPGRRVVGEPAWLSPSFEGVQLAATHVGRLLITLSLVSLLLERMPAQSLLQGLSTLARPLAAVGWDADRLAVRLSLVMQLVTESDGRHWKHWLDDSLDEADRVPTVVAMGTQSFGAADAWVLAVTALIVSCLVAVA
ncbi:MAG: hypothetical protein KDG52_10205 [Rhodocyclaceae bacterium]|nr:hypothetical protein [Rhodocyclaceae bacterium]